MAEWKKIIVSGSDISQLNNDANYLVVTDTIDSASVAERATTLSPEATASFADSASFARMALEGSGSFSGSFEGDGSGLTGLATNLTVDGDTGTQDVDLITDDLQILGTTNEIETAVTKVGTDVKVTLGLPDSITVTASFADRATSASIADEISQLATASFADSATSASNALYALSASVADRATELSSDATASFADSASFARMALEGSGSFSGSFEGDGSGLTGVAAQAGDGIIVTGTEVSVDSGSLAGDGLGVDAGAFKVNVDDSTIETNADALRVKAGGIDTNELATNAVTTDKITDGNVTNAKLDNDSLTIGATEVTLGSTATELVGLTNISATTGSFVLQIFESSSTIITSGSNIFGDTQLDIQQFTGSILQTGSFTTTGTVDADKVTSDKFSGSFSGSFQGDGSNLTGLVTELDIAGDTGTDALDLKTDTLTVQGTANEIETAVTDNTITIGLPDSITVTASFATNAESASEAFHADTASVADRATELSADATASFADRATSASIADEISQLATASFADRATSASIADELSQLATASFADSATSASQAENATSASATIAGQTFPTSDGLNGQALITDGNGSLIYADAFGTGSTAKLNQSVAAATWSFAHNLDEDYPIVQVYDTDGSMILPSEIITIDSDTVEIRFPVAVAGIAAAMVGGMGISASFATTAGFARSTDSASIADELSGLATASFADSASFARLALEGSGSFSGSFEGDGSNLTGIATQLTIDADSGGTSTVDLQTQTFDIAGTAGEIETSLSGQTVTIGLPTSTTIDTLTVSNNATIAGNLTVGGALVSASSLEVADQFIILASGSNGAIDGGIIVNQVDDDPDGRGKAFAYDSSANRWALQSELVDSATTITPDAYMGVIQESAGAPSSDPTYGGTSGKGTIFVDTSNNEAYIYI